MKPQAPLLNAQLKIHKHNIPIRPVVNIQAPTYKITKLKKKLQMILQVLYTYTLYIIQYKSQMT